MHHDALGNMIAAISIRSLITIQILLVYMHFGYVVWRTAIVALLFNVFATIERPSYSLDLHLFTGFLRGLLDSVALCEVLLPCVASRCRKYPTLAQHNTNVYCVIMLYCLE